jgi:hypothetical protein
MTERKDVRLTPDAAVRRMIALEPRIYLALSLPQVVANFRDAVAELRAAEQRGEDVRGPLGTCLDRLYWARRLELEESCTV